MNHPYFDPVRNEVESELKEKTKIQNASIDV